MNDDTRPTGPRKQHLSDAPTGQMRPPVSLSIEAAGHTDKGRVRPGNEDAYGFEPPTSAQARAHGTLLIVSDGMGGHAAGEVASNLAVKTIQDTYYRERGKTAAEAVENSIVAANSAIFNDAEADATRSGMGCTIVVMVVQGSTLTVGHVGDSRGYLIRGGRARQITRDHSWVAMQVAEGVLTPEQAEHHPNRSLLMRALGRQPTVEVEIGHHQLQAGDVLLLCSDGLTGVVTDAEIGDYASRYAPATIADQLVNLANQRGAPDNVTVVAAAIAAPANAAAAAAGTAPTLIAPAADARTPRLGQPAGSAATAPTHRNSPIPGGASPGTPLVLSRESAPPAGGVLSSRRRGRGRWLAGSLAAFGLAAGLVLITLLGPRTAGDPDPPKVADAPAASKPAAPAAPAATVPPPMATGIPGLTPPGGAVAAAPPAPAAAAPPPPAAATPVPPVATPTSASASASKPALTSVPGTVVSVISGILGTPTAPASSPAALGTPTSVPTSTPTPATSGAGGNPSTGTAGPPDSATGASAPPEGAAPAEGDAPEANPDEGVPPMAEEPEQNQPGAEESPAQPTGGQPTNGTRFSPPSGITIPGIGPIRPRGKRDDD
jgi:PPM family protein phosphatase